MAELAAYTCISCRVAFADAGLQRAHYKSDWHRYNLKRKVAELPPVTAENFQERVLAQRAQQAEVEKEKEQSSHCKLCNKSFNSKNSYENHLQSKKHKDAEIKKLQHLSDEVAKRNEKNKEKGIEVLPENEKRLVKDAQNQALKEELKAESSVQSEEAGPSTSSSSGVQSEVPVPSTGTSSTSVQDEAMDSDNESMESWSGEALGLEECLFCSHVSKTFEKNVDHMTRLHSFFIPDLEYVTDLEELFTYLGEKVGEGHICLWCNLKSKAYLTTKAVQQHMVDKGHCKMLFEGDSIFEYSDFFDYRKSYPDFKGGEGDEDMDVDSEIDPEMLSEENYQLVLPSGSSVGHRSLQRYYRQKLRPDRPHKPNAVTRVMAQYKALGWTGTTGLSALQRAKDIAFVQRMKARTHLKLGKKANKFQKFFRDDNYGIK